MGFLLLDNLSGQDFYGMLEKRHLRNARIFIGILLALLLGYLALGPKPWDREFRQSIAKIEAQTPAGEEPKLRTHHYVIPWSYGVAVANALVCVILLVSARAWAQPAADNSLEGDSHLIVEATAWWDTAWWFWGLLMLIMLLGFGIRAPNTGKSLWWDEAWTVKRVIVGYQEPKVESPQELKFHSVPWLKTFYYYEKPTNHVGYSVLARFCVDATRTLTGAEKGSFSENALRFPALVAGVLALALIAMILKDLGHPWLGLIAAALLALHPWHIRYSVDARAFSFCACFSLMAVWALGRALKQGSWRYWIILAIAQFMLLWSFPYTLFYVAIMSVTAVLGIFFAYGGLAASYLQRFLVCGTVAAMLFLQLALPWWPQIQRWGGLMEKEGVEQVNTNLVQEFWVQSALGTPWKLANDVSPPKSDVASNSAAAASKTSSALPSLSNSIGSLPWPLRWLGYALVFGVFPFLLLVGAGRVLITRSPSAMLLLVPAVSVPITLLVALLRSDYFYERYLFFGMPFVLMLILLGAFHLVAGTEGNFRVGGFLSVGVFSLFFIMLSASQLVTVLSRPVEPIREIAEFFDQRRGANPTIPIRAGYQHGGQVPAMYDPWIRQALTANDLKDMAAEAKARKASFYVFYGHEGFNRGMFPDGFTYLDNPLLFVERARFKGLEPDFNYRVLEYSGIPWPEERSAEKTPDGRTTFIPQTRLGEVQLREATTTSPGSSPTTSTAPVLVPGISPGTVKAPPVPSGTLELNPAEAPAVELPQVPPAPTEISPAPAVTPAPAPAPTTAPAPANAPSPAPAPATSPAANRPPANIPAAVPVRRPQAPANSR